MKRYDTSHMLLLAAWLLGCGLIVGAFMWFLMRDTLLAIVLGVATVPFVWVLSSGWQDSDLFRKVLHMQLEERTKRDA